MHSSRVITWRLLLNIIITATVKLQAISDAPKNFPILHRRYSFLPYIMAVLSTEQGRQASKSPAVGLCIRTQYDKAWLAWKGAGTSLEFHSHCGSAEEHHRPCAYELKKLAAWECQDPQRIWPGCCCPEAKKKDTGAGWIVSMSGLCMPPWPTKAMSGG